MSELWFTKLKAILFTHFKAKVSRSIGTDYGNVQFTTEENNLEPTELPTIYFEELVPTEIGTNLDNTSVNAVSETIQITVYSNERSDVKALMDESILAMKALRFNVTGFPIYKTDHDIKFGVARFRRNIGEGDAF